MLLVAFNIGGMISMTQMDDLASTPLYIAVSLFLAFTAVFFAAVTEAQPGLYRVIFVVLRDRRRRDRRILGVLGYFRAPSPAPEIFTKYERAAGAFQDPNVFGPFLTLPGIWPAAPQLMTGSVAHRCRSMPCRCCIIVAGIFFSFSRGAWGLFAISSILLVGGLFPQTSNGSVPAADRGHDHRACIALLHSGTADHPADSGRVGPVHHPRAARPGL